MYSNFPSIINDDRYRATLLNDDEKRWCVYGIVLNHIFIPAVRPYLENNILNEYDALKQYHNIHVQTIHNFPSPKYSHDLHYKNINNNETKDKKNFNYEVKSHVDFGKLFLQSHMAKFNSYNSCDASAVLNLLERIPIFSNLVQNAAKIVRENRNSWGHCNFEEWNETDFQKKIDNMKKLVKELCLATEDEVLNDINHWKDQDFAICDSDIDLYYQKFDQKTRKWFINDFSAWFDEPGESRAFVFMGDAGVGKTVMSAAIAQRAKDDGKLGAAFFCRHYDGTRRDPRSLLASVAYQLDRTLLAGGKENVLYLFETSFFQQKCGPFQLNVDKIHCLAFSPDDKWIFFGTLRFWFSVDERMTVEKTQFPQTDTFYNWASFVEHEHVNYIAVRAENVECRPDDECIFSVTPEKYLTSFKHQIWNVKTGDHVFKLMCESDLNNQWKLNSFFYVWHFFPYTLYKSCFAKLSPKDVVDRYAFNASNVKICNQGIYFINDDRKNWLLRVCMVWPFNLNHRFELLKDEVSIVKEGSVFIHNMPISLHNLIWGDIVCLSSDKNWLLLKHKCKFHLYKFDHSQDHDEVHLKDDTAETSYDSFKLHGVMEGNSDIFGFTHNNNAIIYKIEKIFSLGFWIATSILKVFPDFPLRFVWMRSLYFDRMAKKKRFLYKTFLQIF
ncbi:uncharacterized protein LOC124449295 [Xenia sp. Carnegie-2017]|uniref:uncharacterized protein LOC124449295 n=1 Tax=Xenia sp. Carnegie-2017 TaxID=2897299 RepID=UPI001F033D46|nr:uncharacterized protein LOC124449295 [Xenia sp. Carnegie-2017]